MKNFLNKMGLMLPGLMMAAPALGQTRGQAGWDHPQMWDGMGDWGMMIFGPLMMITFIAVTVIVVVLVVRWLGGTQGSGAGHNQARNVLDERYAKGEIDREDYLARKKDLS